MHNYTIAELVKGLQSKKFSSVELTQHFLSRINRFNGQYNAVITVTADQALQAAYLADQRLAFGSAPALCGVPYCTKISFALRVYEQVVALKCWTTLYPLTTLPLWKISSRPAW
jgi:Asp-tRNA(Asn)/Glu-tRNA(Gln) amidotransferase A subunit family amidase